MKKIAQVFSIFALIISCSAISYRIGYSNAVYDVFKNHAENQIMIQGEENLDTLVKRAKLK